MDEPKLSPSTPETDESERRVWLDECSCAWVSSEFGHRKLLGFGRRYDPLDHPLTEVLIFRHRTGMLDEVSRSQFEDLASRPRSRVRLRIIDGDIEL